MTDTNWKTNRIVILIIGALIESDALFCQDFAMARKLTLV